MYRPPPQSGKQTYRNDVFISYRGGGASESFTLELRDRLMTTKNRRGLAPSIFLDRTAIFPGAIVLEALGTALYSCHRFLAVLTRDYFKSGFCSLEFERAFSRDKDGKLGIVVPILAEPLDSETDIPKIYGARNYRVYGPHLFPMLCRQLDLVAPGDRESAQDSAESFKAFVPVFTPEGLLLQRGISFARVQSGDREFWLSCSPITVGDVKYLRGSKPPRDPDFNHNWAYEDHPMVNVTWQEAQLYCEQIGCGGRLPRFEEWNLARQGARAEKLPMVHSWSASGSVDGQRTCATGPSSGKVPDRDGFYDLADNVWEWCADPGPGSKDRLVCGRAATLTRINRNLTLPHRDVGFRCLIDNPWI